METILTDNEKALLEYAFQVRDNQTEEQRAAIRLNAWWTGD
jgi:hypothetical protein